MQNEIRIHPVEAPSLGAVLGFIALAYRRYSGTIDREQAGCPKPGQDAAGQTLQYFAAEQGGRTIAAVGLSPGGAIGDWALERSPEAHRVLPRLLEEAERWAVARHARTLELVSPSGDALPERMLLSLGFRPVSPPVTSIRILDFAALLTSLSRVAHESAVRLAPFVLHLHLGRGGDPAPAQPDITVRVSKDVVRVEPVVPAHADAIATTTATALTRFLFSVGGDHAFLANHVAVAPSSAATRAHAIVSSFQVPRPWFSPPGEHR